MQTSLRLGTVLGLALSLAACGGDGDVTLDNFGDKLVSAVCDRQIRCGTYVSKAACLEEISLSVETVKKAVAAGRMAFDGDAMADCIGTLAAASCDSSAVANRGTPAVCLDALKGIVADGGACFSSQECVSDSCNVPDCGMACCAGTCDPTVADAAVGQSCATADCVDGAFCNANDVCASLVVAGGACQSNAECAYGLTCAGSVCVTAANRGESCDADGDCQDIGDRCDATNKCVARSGAGGVCAAGFAGFFDCQRPLVCNDTTLKCENPPAVGQACSFSCASGAFCNQQGSCEAVRADGAACAGDEECASDFCDQSGANGVCAVEPICG